MFYIKTLATAINLIIIGSALLRGIFRARNNLLRRLRISLCTSSLFIQSTTINFAIAPFISGANATAIALSISFSSSS
ncbi:MAG: hypothetical protein QNJ34_09920 [Xenococcaceae cyanobacterium MO_188.B29]|nr:hypothetical protein [Xenococcaceae cyanobacterium MO_188.B29]